MRLAPLLVIAVLVSTLGAPAFAQQLDPGMPTPETPPEGFYRGIPGAYDLLLRPQQLPKDIQVSRPAPDCLVPDGTRVEPANPEIREFIEKLAREANGLTLTNCRLLLKEPDAKPAPAPDAKPEAKPEARKD